jgi:hypothetical protein
MLTGFPEKLQRLYNHNPSFNRIFRSYDLGPLTKSEVSSFFEDTFKKVNVKIDNDALNDMIDFSAGIPTMMQEIGDGVFWEDTDPFIDKKDARHGIFEAGIQIGKKFVKPEIDSSIYSIKYRSILLKMGEHTIISFKKSDFEKYLNEEEKRVFPDFLLRAKKLKILEQDIPRSGIYKFPNMLYPVYLAILSIRNEKL